MEQSDMPCPDCKDLSVPERILCPCATPVIENSGCLTIQEARDLSRNFRNSLYDDLTFIEVESPIDFKTRVPLPEVEYIDPEIYSAVGFRVVCNPGNIHCITASSPELAQRVAELLNQDGWNAKKAKLQTTTPSGASSD
jgi:hypothetical protein